MSPEDKLVSTAPLPSAKLPLLTVISAGTTNRRVNTVGEPRTAPPPLRKLVPVPDSVPPVRVNNPLKLMLPSPVSEPADCKKFATVALIVLLTVSVPLVSVAVPCPLTVLPINLKSALLHWATAPASTCTVPRHSPFPCNRSVPAPTFTRLLLNNSTLTALLLAPWPLMPLPAPSFSSTPLFQIAAAAPPPLPTLESSRILMSPEDKLVSTAPLPSAKLPLLIVSSVGTTNRRVNRIGEPRTTPPPLRKLVPVPDSVPPVRVNNPLKFMLPSPVSVPPDCKKFATVALIVLLTVSVPPTSAAVPSPLTVLPINLKSVLFHWTSAPASTCTVPRHSPPPCSRSVPTPTFTILLLKNGTLITLMPGPWPVMLLLAPAFWNSP